MEKLITDQLNPEQATRFENIPDVLAKIVTDKALTLEKQKRDMPLSSFINKLEPSRRDFYQALDKGNTGFILECKKASPSKGLIRKDFDITAIAKVYQKYAAAISVLTEEKYFQGNFEYLRTVSKTVTCPVLNKDFIFDPYQVYLARFFGADAILLMLSVLDDEQYRELANLASQYNLDVLTEVSNEQERDRAIALGAKIIGINNRNLRDLTTDLEQTFKLVPGIPDDRVIISESGIYTHQQARKLAPVAHGFLVGSSIMAEGNIDLACRKLIYGNHKVCGLTSASDARNASKAGAVMGGLIFASMSPRFISLKIAQDIVKQTPELEYVGVFVNQSIEEVAQAVEKLQLSRVQLHGDESEEYMRALNQRLQDSQCQIIKAHLVNDFLPKLSIEADGHLLDSRTPGSGKSFNWQSFQSSSENYSSAMLAGGLGPENTAEALSVCQEYGLSGMDFNSGVEASPGVKDAAKLDHVFSIIRNY